MSTLSLKSSDKVLLLWGGEVQPDLIQTTVEQLKTTVKEGSVQVENIHRLTMANHSASSFDVILSGIIPPPSVLHTMDILAEIARLLKPSGRLIMDEAMEANSADKTSSILTMSGFIDISKEEKSNVKRFTAAKPSYEVGTSTQLKLSFAVKPKTQDPAPKVDTNVAKVWSLSANDMLDDDIDIMDSDELLDEDDLKKPDPESLKAPACGPNSASKKACKNCSCGFADELNGTSGQAKKSTEQASACGSCYLGDAFRCSSCPYLGMPAFKPGEKIQLSTRQLNADS
ncbi:unnamed protein product [Owenia fusiformis]|uniref:Anamorsin homolog n=1 Tax=Owenia fusiformis TaxID=6347 RepID=A0A8J1UTK3_OWEFU|nr:unnamed protein product [Owenia fusiformis]